jgi:hypothetical protein
LSGAVARSVAFSAAASHHAASQKELAAGGGVGEAAAAAACPSFLPFFCQIDRARKKEAKAGREPTTLTFLLNFGNSITGYLENRMHDAQKRKT